MWAYHFITSIYFFLPEEAETKIIPEKIIFSATQTSDNEDRVEVRIDNWLDSCTEINSDSAVEFLQRTIFEQISDGLLNYMHEFME